MTGSAKNYRGSLQNLPIDERPQERLEKLGPKALSDRELLAVLLRTGTPKLDILQLADYIIKQAGSLAGLVRWDVSEFQKIPGIGKIKSLQLSAYVEVAQRLAHGHRLEKLVVDEPAKVWDFLYPETISECVEKVWVLCLDRKNRILRSEVITSGTATSSLIHPREVFRPAIRWGATAIILAHNHPSGDPTPSKSDLQVTRKISEASKCLEIDFFDHVIIGDPNICPSNRGYYSFSDNGLA